MVSILQEAKEKSQVRSKYGWSKDHDPERRDAYLKNRGFRPGISPIFYREAAGVNSVSSSSPW